MDITELTDGNITLPKGFSAAGIHAGIKKSKKDISLVVSDAPCEFAGLFTRNIVKAAPVKWDMRLNEKGGKVRGLTIVSGNANACAGKRGDDDNEIIADTTAAAIGAEKDEILVCCTGVIGVPLPMAAVTKGVKAAAKALGASPEHGTAAAEAIVTTDTFIKTAAARINVGGKTVTLGGMAKGSGMIHPNMATMLAIITTDADISRAALTAALTDCVGLTYNMISVDGDTSTNDTALILAGGAARNDRIELGGPGYQLFRDALLALSRKLAMDIARDGEGATKLIEVTVTGAKTYDDARKLARAVTSGSLFKAAVFGADANWGRVVSAMGACGAYFNPDGASISLSGGEEITLMRRGAPADFDETRAKARLSCKDVFVSISLTDGNESATAWGCDLTYDYVKINGEYRS